MVKESTKDAAAIVKELIAADTLPHSILVTGPDRVRRERIRDVLLKKAAADPAGAPEIRRLKADELDGAALAALADDARTLSLFASAKLALIERIDGIRQEAAKSLCELIAAPDGGCRFLLIGGPLPAVHPLVKAHRKAPLACVTLEELKGVQLKNWIAKELRSSGIKEFDDDIVTYLIEAGEGSPDRISRCVEQLTLYLDGAKPTRDDVAALFSTVPDPGEFALIDALTSGSLTRAELTVNELLARGKSPFMLLALVSRMYSRYLVIAGETARGRGGPALRQELGMTPWAFDKGLSAARRYTVAELCEHTAALLRADSRLKNRSLGPELILSDLCSALCSRAAAR